MIYDKLEKNLKPLVDEVYNLKSEDGKLDMQILGVVNEEEYI
jgi:hypothetical protein